MKLLCPCGEKFESRRFGDVIQLLCDSCSAFHHHGLGEIAPSWIETKKSNVIALDFVRSADA